MENNSLYSKNRYLVNIEDNTLYSTSTYNLVTTLNQDFFQASVMMDRLSSEQTITQCLRTPLFMKKGRTLSYPALKEQTYDAKYPHVLYQNHLGQLVSISKGLIGSLKFSAVERDIFVEIIK
jgi:hypothetical protein